MKEKIIQTLMQTNRPNIDKLIDYLNENGFFESAASTKFHGNYKGGLAEHSWNVYSMFHKLCKAFKIDVPVNSQIICGILHDVCKINQYIFDPITSNYRWNKNNPQGHATLSLERIKKYIELTELEETMIKYHMGVYGSEEWNTESWQHSEYTLKEGQDTFHKNNKVLLFHMADNMCSAFIEKTRAEKLAEQNEFEKSQI